MSNNNFNISRGHCYVFFAFDIGLSIDLEACDKLIKESKERTRFRQNRRSPVYFDYDPPPLRITQQGEQIKNGNFLASSAVDLTLFDFGALSVCYTLDYNGPFADLVILSDELYSNKILLDDAKERVRQLVKEINSAVKNPALSDLIEDYTVYHIESFGDDTNINLKTFWDDHAGTIAKILRSENETLSGQEIADALSCRISYSVNEEIAIDWNAAIVIGSEFDDVKAVLEFGNIDLLEMRYLDEQLDDALEHAYQANTSGKNVRTDLRKVAQLQVDSAMMYEAVNNALKLTGDQYLARLYSLLSKRLHLADWDASILRKLSTLDSIYQKIVDRADQKRSEYMEIVIIVLITIEVLYTFSGLLKH